MIRDEIVLQKLANWPAASGRETLTVAEDGTGWSLQLAVDRHDELGCLVWEMNLFRLATPEQDANLTDWAHRVADRVTGLLEPLKVVEIDHQKNEAMLRSEQPSRRGDKLGYYEAILKNTRQASMCRYQGAFPGGGKREQVAFALTNEVLAKLIEDVTAEK